MGKIIRTDYVELPSKPKKGNYYTLKELQAIVGGHIEIVRLGSDKIMVVHAEGKFKCKLNIKATLIFRKAIKDMYGVDSKDSVFGDVLICDNKEVL